VVAGDPDAVPNGDADEADDADGKADVDVLRGSDPTALSLLTALSPLLV
jgi:hypothetical protein